MLNVIIGLIKMLNIELSNKIINLRRQGYSIKCIAKQIGCCKSTASFYCKDVKLTNEQLVLFNDKWQANLQLARNASKLKWLLEKKKIRESAIKEWNEINNNSELMLFLGLYWGEGDKAISGRVGVCNNDPIIISKCLDVFNRFSNTKKVIYVKLYPDHNIDDCRNFWFKLIGNKAELRFTRIKDIRIGHKKHRSKYGLAVLRFGDYRLFYKIMQWIDCLRQQASVV